MIVKRIAKIARSTKTWLVIVALLGVVVAVRLAESGQLSDPQVHQELFRFSLTVVVGGVIAFVFRMAEVRRQIRDARQRDLRDFYRRMLGAYNDAKKTRRLLRARSHVDGHSVEISRKDLDDLMADLQSAQLELEALRREAEASHKLFTDSAAVEGYLARAQKYLRGVLKVYERMGRTGATVRFGFGAPECRKLLCFFHDKAELEDRYLPAEDCRSFDVEFSDQVHEIRRLIVGISEDAAVAD